MSAFFDNEAFLQSLANDEELARELLEAFMEDSPARLDSLRQSLENDDAEGASKFAHSLKGMCGVVRAKSLVDTALSMENSSKQGQLDKTREQFAGFEDNLQIVHKEIREFLTR